MSSPQPLPVALLDGNANVVAVNSALEELVGQPSDSILGRPFAAICVPTDTTAASKVVTDALAGRIATATIPLWREHAPQDLVLSVDFAVMQIGHSPGLLVTVTSWSRDEGVDAPSLGDFTYSISLKAFGTIRWAKRGAQARDTRLVGKLCFEALFDRNGPCEGCPLRKPGPGQTTGVVVGPPSNGGVPFVVTACKASSTAAIVTATAIEHSLLRALIRIETDRRAEGAGLSTREREILAHLLLGRSSAEIATVLDIAVSTAKYHQGNVLRKLGATSRVDLFHRLF